MSASVEVHGIESLPATMTDLVVARLRLLGRRRAAWLVHLWGDSDPDLLRVGLDARDHPDHETGWYADAPAVRACNSALGRIDHALSGEAGAPLRRLQELFALSAGELDVLQLCLALALEPALGPVCARLQPHPGRAHATEPLAARLFGHGYRRLLHPGAPLLVWGLVHAAEPLPGEPAALTINPQLLDWLQGRLGVDPLLVGAVSPIDPPQPPPAWPLDETLDLIRRAVQRQAALRIVLSGPAGSGRRTFAAVAATHLGLTAVAVDTSVVADEDWPQTYVAAQRLALLGALVLVWHGSALARPWPRRVGPPALQFVAADPDQAPAPLADVFDHHVQLPAPGVAERHSLWSAAIPEAVAWPRHALDTLAARYRLTPGDILGIARRGPADAGQAMALARELTRDRLGELGRLLDCPFTWDDLVLPATLREALADFAFEAADRAGFWDDPAARRLFPRGIGLVALFSGPPGTGKTMAAQVVAAELGLDLFRIDLATVVSKYIGETAKNLRRIFARATHMNAVLLFDEADALFSKRTDVKDSHDRYANADTGYMLELLEDYRGIAVLASNKRSNIDPAFTRRVRYVYEFPRPEADERRRIWQQVLVALAGPEAGRRLQPAVDAFAGAIQLTGAQIKNSVLAAVFVARRQGGPLVMPHLLRALERELSKEGRSLGSREREELGRHV